MTLKCIYNEWRGFFGWTSDIRSLFARSWKEQESSSLRTVIKTFFFLLSFRFWLDANTIKMKLFISSLLKWTWLVYIIIYFYFSHVKILELFFVTANCVPFWHYILTGSFYSCGWWNLAIFWLCCCKHGWLKTSNTSCNCLSPLAADHSFSLYIPTGAFWPWVSCELLIFY